MIKWKEVEVDVAELKPYERNPRRISEEAYSLLKESIQSLGYHQRIITQPDKTVIGGHQRIRALTELGIKRVKILVPDRELTQDEFRKLLIQDNVAFGEFDFDILAADFDVDELLEFGVPRSLLGFFATPEDKDAEWKGMPEFNQDDAGAYRSIIIHFANPEDIKKFAELISQNITDKTKYLWFPKAERADAKNMGYQVEGEDDAT